MSDVKITEQEGSLWVETPYSGLAILPPRAVAALRAYFAAERMPEDVQALVDEAREFTDPEIGYTLSEYDTGQVMPLIDRLTAALEAAYSKGAVDDPR